jgi:hypothetical protein
MMAPPKQYFVYLFKCVIAADYSIVVVVLPAAVHMSVCLDLLQQRHE